MNKSIKLSAIILFVLILLQSCGDFLDTSPYSGIDDSKAISNQENATAALIGVYNSFRHYNYYGRDFVIEGEVQTNNIRLNPTNSNRFIPQISWSVTKSDADIPKFWNKAYEAINRANNVINKSIEGDEKIVNSIKGEAYALRALAHFDLVRMFAQCYDFTSDHSHLGVPYVKVYDPQGQPTRNAVSEVYENIVLDLKKAQELGVEGFSRKMPPYTLSTDALNAILAKVYLYMGDFNNAKIYAELVIPKYTLISHDNYIGSWKEQKTTESIFTVAHTDIDYDGTNSLGYILIEAGYGDILVNEGFYNLYDDNDVRKAWYVKGSKTQNKEKLYAKGKYPGRGNAGLDNFNVIRLSEIYLIAAEACAKADVKDETKAQKYLNAIRQRSIPTAAAVTSTGQILIDEILLEKRKELAFEGNYYHDLKRLKMNVTAGVIGIQSPKVLEYPNDLFAWPIPEDEINANPNIAKQQNPGY